MRSDYLPCLAKATAGIEDVVIILIAAQLLSGAESPPPPQFCAKEVAAST